MLDFSYTGSGELGGGRMIPQKSHSVFEAAIARGYRVMRLDTGSFMTEALALYTGFGFVRIPPYYPVDETLASEFVFMERMLIA